MRRVLRTDERSDNLSVNRMYLYDEEGNPVSTVVFLDPREGKAVRIRQVDQTQLNIIEALMKTVNSKGLTVDLAPPTQQSPTGEMWDDRRLAEVIRDTATQLIGLMNMSEDRGIRTELDYSYLERRGTGRGLPDRRYHQIVIGAWKNVLGSDVVDGLTAPL